MLAYHRPMWSIVFTYRTKRLTNAAYHYTHTSLHGVVVSCCCSLTFQPINAWDYNANIKHKGVHITKLGTRLSKFKT